MFKCLGWPCPATFILLLFETPILTLCLLAPRNMLGAHRGRLRNETGWAEFNYFKMVALRALRCPTAGQEEQRLWERDCSGSEEWYHLTYLAGVNARVCENVFIHNDR